jgi:hypothetical protein
VSGWAERWQGGLCPVGALGGLPIRDREYRANPPLDQLLVLPGLAVSLADRAAATAAWSAALGAPVVLARGLEPARAALLAALGVAPGDLVALPANATRALVEAVKARGARPAFLPLDPSLALADDAPVEAALVWAQPVAGLSEPGPVAGAALIADHGETLPALADDADLAPLPLAGARASRTPLLADDAWAAEPRAAGPIATLWGLHLTADPAEAGALIAFAPGQEGLAERVSAGLAGDGPDPARALAQLARLSGRPGLAARQRRALVETGLGLSEAAGLALLPIASRPGAGQPGVPALAHGVAVQVPLESEPSTFYGYLRGENTPVRWLPELRPVHYAAVRGLDQAWRASAVNLARWLMVPVGPDYSADEVGQAVLGVVKASDYLGVRWRLDPARAASYARSMDERYGPDHDAYRPIFCPSLPDAAEGQNVRRAGSGGTADRPRP